MKRVVKDIVFLGVGNVNISKIRWDSFQSSLQKPCSRAPAQSSSEWPRNNLTLARDLLTSEQARCSAIQSRAQKV